MQVIQNNMQQTVHLSFILQLTNKFNPVEDIKSPGPVRYEKKLDYGFKSSLILMPELKEPIVLDWRSEVLMVKNTDGNKRQ